MSTPCSRYRSLCRLLIAVILFPMAHGVHGDSALFLENGTLYAAMDKTSGLLTVTDKRTGQKWHQFYNTLAGGTQMLSDPGFSSPLGRSWRCADTGSIDLKRITLDQMNEFALALDVGTLKNVPPQGGNFTTRLVANRVPLVKSNYTLRVRYKTESVTNFTVRANIYVQNSSGPSPTLVPGRLVFDTPQGSEWKIVEWPIPDTSLIGDFVTVFFDLTSVGGTGHGRFYLSEIALISTGLESNIPYRFTNMIKNNSSITFDLVAPVKDTGTITVNGALSLDPSDPAGLEMVMRADPSAAMVSLAYPPFFHSTRPDLNWVVPAYSGLLLPSMDTTLKENREGLHGSAYSRVFTMGFVGATNLTRGDGYLYVIDSMADARLEYAFSALGPNQKAYLPQIVYNGDKDLFGRPKKVRLKFLTGGGYVAVARRYREIAREKGYLVTLKEKERIVPDIAKAVSAPVIHSFEARDSVIAMIHDLVAAGIPRAQINAYYRTVNNMEVPRAHIYDDKPFLDLIDGSGYVAWEYDNYRDIFPDTASKIDRQIQPVKTWLYSEDKMLMTKDQKMRVGWITGTGIATYLMCQAFNVETARRHVEPIIDQTQGKIRYWFVDVLASVSPAEAICHHPNHPTSFRDVMVYRSGLLEHLMTEYKLIAGIECFAEYLVPWSVAGEGNIYLIGGPDSVRSVARIPLWNLVYNDCFQLYFHSGGNENNRSRETWGERDAVIALYGGKQKFRFLRPPFSTIGSWSSQSTEVVASIKKVNESLFQTHYKPMTDHRFLTGDRLVQMTEFGPGVKVVANFSDADYVYNGVTVKCRDFVTIGQVTPTVQPQYSTASAPVLKKVAVYDLRGRMLFSSDNQKTSPPVERLRYQAMPVSESIDLGFLAHGMYVARFIYEDRTEEVKFLKSRSPFVLRSSRVTSPGVK